MFERKHAESYDQLRIQRDRRADEGKRQVSVTSKDVLIARRLAGISMFISVPVAAYRGVALDVRPSGNGGASYRLSLAHRDPDLDIVLTETEDAGAVPAEWTHWASTLELPRLAGKDGEFETPDPRIGQAAAPGAFARRRNGAVTKRRPRFLTRRKSGVVSRMNTLFEARDIIG